MSKADDIAFKYAKKNGTLGYDYNQIYDAVKYGYEQAIEKAVKWLRIYQGKKFDYLHFESIAEFEKTMLGN